MTLFLRDIKRAIAKAIRETEGLAPDEKFDLVDKAMDLCDTLENAQEYIIQRGLNVPIGEYLANTIAAEAQEQLGNLSGDRIEMSDIYTPEQADEMREEESAREDASLQNRTTTIDLHECEVIGSGVDQASKVQVAAALSGWGYGNPCARRQRVPER